MTPVSGWLSVFASVGDAALNILVSFYIRVHVFQLYVPVGGTSGHWVCLYANSVMPNSFLEWLCQLTSLSVAYESLPPHGCQYLVGTKI